MMTNCQDPRGERFLVDKFLKVVGTDNIYAMGDCALIEGNPLQATAQVAQQQGAYLANSFNTMVCSDLIGTLVSEWWLIS
jgi:NADH dehydrogenase FAD-containing subunit